MGDRRVHLVRVRGGGVKFRALRLDTGNWSWATEACTRKARIISVVYNATSNELVRTNTLVKGAIVEIDAAPFKAWYLKYYGVHLGKQKKETEKEPAATTTKASEKAQEKPQEKAQQGKTKGGATTTGKKSNQRKTGDNGDNDGKTQRSGKDIDDRKINGKDDRTGTT
jgi:small subunit ribosomal protein S8e